MASAMDKIKQKMAAMKEEADLNEARVAELEKLVREANERASNVRGHGI